MVIRETKVAEERKSRFLDFLKSFKMALSLDKAKVKKP